MVKPIESSFMIHPYLIYQKITLFTCSTYFFLIAVPPQKPLIVDDRGRQVEGEVGIGPFREGESLSLECNVPGGKWKCVNNGSITLLLPSFLQKNKGWNITFPWGERKQTHDDVSDINYRVMCTVSILSNFAHFGRGRRQQKVLLLLRNLIKERLESTTTSFCGQESYTVIK